MATYIVNLDKFHSGTQNRTTDKSSLISQRPQNINEGFQKHAMESNSAGMVTCACIGGQLADISEFCGGGGDDDDVTIEW